MFTDDKDTPKTSRVRDGFFLSLGLGLGAGLAYYLSGRDGAEPERFTLYEIAQEAVQDLVEAA